jgi:hypothetical protein
MKTIYEIKIIILAPATIGNPVALDEDWCMATPNEAIVGNPVNLIATNDNLAYANNKQLEEPKTELPNYNG